MAQVFGLVVAKEFSTIECGDCGIVFAIESWLKTKWVNERHDFTCPNGHSWRFCGETEAERIKRELTAELEATKRETEWARVRANTAEKQLRVQRGQVTKLRNRIKAGVCPCCHRTFKQLAAHMATQHPDFTAEPPVIQEA